MEFPDSAGRGSRKSAKGPRQLSRARQPRAGSTNTTRELILTAAAASFAELGFDRTSMREIAKLSGITAGAIYTHFVNKAELLMEVVKRALDALPLSANLITGEEDPEILLENAAIHTDPDARMLRRLSLEVHSAAARDKDVKALLLDYDEMVMAKLRKIIERGHRNGKIDRARQPEFTVRAVAVFIMGLNHLDTLSPQLLGDPSWRRFVAATVTNLLGLKNHASSKKPASNSRTKRQLISRASTK